MNANEIRKAIDSGSKVYWSNYAYEVIKDSIGQYLIKCHINNSYIGLTHRDGVTLNGKEQDFFMEEV